MDPPRNMIPRRVAYIVSEDLVKIASLLPSNTDRSLLVHSLVLSLRLLASETVARARAVRPGRASKAHLNAYHDDQYVEFVMNPMNSVEGPVSSDHIRFGLEDDCPVFRGLPLYVSTIAGGALKAVETLRVHDANTDLAIFWDGGRHRHHAQKSSASGFCYVADGVLAILAMLRPLPMPRPPASTADPTAKITPTLYRPRVMYLDLDVHFGDGVAAAFHQRGRGRSGASSHVLTMSIHHSSPGFFPGSELGELPRLPKEPILRRVAFAGVDPPSDDDDDAVEEEDWDPYTLSVPLAIGTSSETMAKIWRTTVEPIRRAFAPHFLVLQCGADGLAGDPCSVWNWSSGGPTSAKEEGPEEGSMGWCVQQACEWGCKILLTGGGGYNSPNVARTYAYLTSIALGQPLPRDHPIPDHAHFAAYAPSFTLDVPAGTMRDQNTEVYLREVERTFVRIAKDVRSRRIDAEMQK